MKKLLLENLATKAMAFLLAVLTWVYLFTQGNDTKQIKVEFQPPALDRQVFASLVYKDGSGRVLEPGAQDLEVKLSGPRGDVRSYSQDTSKILLDLKLLNAPLGVVPITLEQSYFGLPGAIQVQPLPAKQITLEYVKYLDMDIDLDAPLAEGKPREGSRVESLHVLPTRIKAKVPADLTLKPGEKVAVRRIPVAGRFENFTLENWELEPGSRIVPDPQVPFRAEVRVVAVPATRRLPLDLHLATKEENKARVKLDTKTVTAELQGPKELIDGAPEAAFAPYVVVTDADVATLGPKNINLPALGCHILDPKYLGKVTVVLMPDVTPENRQVKITVLPK